jgi:hypothetical protein
LSLLLYRRQWANSSQDDEIANNDEGQAGGQYNARTCDNRDLTFDIGAQREFVAGRLQPEHATTE